MSKTLGFYILEKYSRKYQCWPSSRGLRGFRLMILIMVNMLWSIYPLIIEIIDYKTNFVTCLFHMEFITAGCVSFGGCIHVMRNQHRLFEIIHLLSDFNQFGNPERIKIIEKRMKTVLKTICYGGHFIAYIIAYFVILDDNCGNFKSTKYCLILEYYVPFDLKHWEITLIVLFEIYTIGITINIIFIAIVFYCYVIELLVVRIKDLNEVISNMNLTKNKKTNFVILRPIYLYHQHIFRLFQISEKFLTSLIIPQKLFCLISLTISTTEFVLRKDLTSFLMITLNIWALFIMHTTGQRFTTTAGSVADTVYNLNWYDADLSTRKDILILLCMSQRTLTLELPLFGNISHTAAANEYKKVYVFYNWILKVTKQRNL